MKEKRPYKSILQPVVRYCLPIGASIAVVVEVLSAFHFLGKVVSADCVTTSVLTRWPHEFGLFFVTNAVVVCLASFAHGLLYDEFLSKGWRTDPSAEPRKRYSALLKKIYLATLIPLLLVVGYFSATIIMTEYLRLPGAISYGC